MRVLFWTDWFLPSIGGVEVFSSRLLPELKHRGWDVVVVAGHHQAGLPDQSVWNGVPVCRFSFHQVLAEGDLAKIAAIRRKIADLKQSLRPDLVHLNTLGPSTLFHLETAKCCPAPLLLTMHSPVMPDAERQDTLYGRALRSADWINCNSHAVRRDLCRRAPELRERSSVTYYGIDPPALAPRSRPRQSPVLLGYGRLVRDKGFDLALRAFADVLPAVPEARFVLAGDGDARPELESMAASMGLGSAVSFVGAVSPDEVFRLIDAASVVVVPSRWQEPFGLVALEAALMARPVVATRLGGLAEVVEHGRTGLVVEPEDASAMTRAILRLFQDHEFADTMGETARDRARERFSWDRCVGAYERLYSRTRHFPSRFGGDE